MPKLHIIVTAVVSLSIITTLMNPTRIYAKPECNFRVGGMTVSDVNNNQKADAEDTPIPDIEVRISFDDISKPDLILKSDAVGKWGATLCIGKYTASVNTAFTPKDHVLTSKNRIQFGFYSDSKPKTVDFLFDTELFPQAKIVTMDFVDDDSEPTPGIPFIYVAGGLVLFTTNVVFWVVIFKRRLKALQR